ncbi:MAG: DJ-1/PfpI family protein [Thermomicrobiales bacterium]
MTNATPSHRRTVGILIFPEVEVLDFCGPFEVFAITRSGDSLADDERLFDVYTIAEEDRLIRCRGGLQVQPHYTFDNHPPLDILVVPGGAGADVIYAGNDRVLDWIAAQATQIELTTSVCTGAQLLAKRGLLDGHQATTHWLGIDELKQRHPAVDVVSGARFVDAGPVVTSAGVSAGIDMSLHVVGRLYGEHIAARTARIMEYDGYTPSPAQ